MGRQDKGELSNALSLSVCVSVRLSSPSCLPLFIASFPSVFPFLTLSPLRPSSSSPFPSISSYLFAVTVFFPSWSLHGFLLPPFTPFLSFVSFLRFYHVFYSVLFFSPFPCSVTLCRFFLPFFSFPFFLLDSFSTYLFYPPLYCFLFRSFFYPLFLYYFLLFHLCDALSLSCFIYNLFSVSILL